MTFMQQVIDLYTQIKKLNRNYQDDIQAIIDNKTKPLGALGLIEQLALQLALVQHQESCDISGKINDKARMLVFAGDHGIAKEGVSIAPSEVTGQMVMNFLHGGAAINCFCRSNDIEMDVIDCGILNAVDGQYEILREQRLGNGTSNFALQPAMSISQVCEGIQYGEQLVSEYVNRGYYILMLGEMGIGNTSSAAAIMSALTDIPLTQCVGKGTGITDEQYARKLALITQALARFDSHEPLTVLAEVGGFEIVQMVGVILAAANARITVVIDGFIVSAAALVAYKLNTNVLDYLVFSHVSEESGHQALLNEMSATAILNLQLRLGEGTGAALAYPMLKAAASFYNDMACFESAGVHV